MYSTRRFKHALAIAILLFAISTVFGLSTSSAESDPPGNETSTTTTEVPPVTTTTVPDVPVLMGPQDHCGTIATDQRWGPGVHTLSCNSTVSSSATLYLDPGAQVILDRDLNNQGTLIAVGMPGNPVELSGSSRLRISSTGTAALSHVTFDDARVAVESPTSSIQVSDSLIISTAFSVSGSISITNSQLTGGSIISGTGTTTIVDNEIDNTTLTLNKPAFHGNHIDGDKRVSVKGNLGGFHSNTVASTAGNTARNLSIPAGAVLAATTGFDGFDTITVEGIHTVNLPADTALQLPTGITVTGSGRWNLQGQLTGNNINWVSTGTITNATQPVVTVNSPNGSTAPASLTLNGGTFAASVQIGSPNTSTAPNPPGSAVHLSNLEHTGAARLGQTGQLHLNNVSSTDPRFEARYVNNSWTYDSSGSISITNSQLTGGSIISGTSGLTVTNSVLNKVSLRPAASSAVTLNAGTRVIIGSGQVGVELSGTSQLTAEGSSLLPVVFTSTCDPTLPPEFYDPTCTSPFDKRPAAAVAAAGGYVGGAGARLYLTGTTIAFARTGLDLGSAMFGFGLLEAFDTGRFGIHNTDFIATDDAVKYAPTWRDKLVSVCGYSSYIPMTGTYMGPDGQGWRPRIGYLPSLAGSRVDAAMENIGGVPQAAYDAFESSRDGLDTVNKVVEYETGNPLLGDQFDPGSWSVGGLVSAFLDGSLGNVDLPEGRNRLPFSVERCDIPIPGGVIPVPVSSVPFTTPAVRVQSSSQPVTTAGTAIVAALPTFPARSYLAGTQSLPLFGTLSVPVDLLEEFFGNGEVAAYAPLGPVPAATLTPSSITQNAVSFSWTDTDNSGERKYKVRVYPTAEGPGHSVPAVLRNRQVRVTGLVPDTTYTFEVQVVKEGIESSPLTVEVTTAP